MDIKTVTLLSHVDHTLLSPSAVWQDVRAVCDDAVNYHTASVCIPACYVKQAKEYVRDAMRVGTVIGFPNGYSTAKAKAFEAHDAVMDGADEIDMVINIGFLKSGRTDEVLSEIQRVKSACEGRVLKVIIETCLLTHEEKLKMCEIVSKSGADYIKTSTGFSSGGATFDDVKLMRANVKPHVRVKAAGGISSIEDAQEFLRLGADRLGTSKIIKILKSEAAKT